MVLPPPPSKAVKRTRKLKADIWASLEEEKALLIDDNHNAPTRHSVIPSKSSSQMKDNVTDENNKKKKKSKSKTTTLWVDEWFYKDSRGMIQGPFTSQLMIQWFKANYFDRNTPLRNGRDGAFDNFCKFDLSAPLKQQHAAVTKKLQQQQQLLQQQQQQQYQQPREISLDERLALLKREHASKKEENLDDRIAALRGNSGPSRPPPPPPPPPPLDDTRDNNILQKVPLIEGVEEGEMISQAISDIPYPSLDTPAYPQDNSIELPVAYPGLYGEDGEAVGAYPLPEGYDGVEGGSVVAAYTANDDGATSYEYPYETAVAAYPLPPSANNSKTLLGNNDIKFQQRKQELKKFKGDKSVAAFLPAGVAGKKRKAVSKHEEEATVCSVVKPKQQSATADYDDFMNQVKSMQ